MAKTHPESDVEEWLNQLDPSTITARDGAPRRAIGQAVFAIEAAETQLKEAVDAAKAAGLSWGSIAMVLNTSKQAADRHGAQHLQAGGPSQVWTEARKDRECRGCRKGRADQRGLGRGTPPQHRDERRCTQADLAQRAGVSRSVVADPEAGKATRTNIHHLDTTRLGEVIAWLAEFTTPPRGD
ncbi:MAG: hypothetical protein LH471_05030 [Salinibacterium sp.]|nr:hypothetical protein [Salinibacterium sp.]